MQNRTALRKQGVTTTRTRESKADLAAQVAALQEENARLKASKKSGPKTAFYQKVGPSGTMVIGFGLQKASFYPSQIAKVLKDQVKVIDAILDAEHAIVPEDDKDAFKERNKALKSPAVSFRSMEEREETLAVLSHIREHMVKLGEDSLEDRVESGEA